MIFFKETEENKIGIFDLKNSTQEEMKEVIRRALDGEIDGIPEFRVSKTTYEFSTVFIIEFIEKFNFVIGSIHPEKTLSVISSNDKQIELSQKNGTKITIELK